MKNYKNTKKLKRSIPALAIILITLIAAMLFISCAKGGDQTTAASATPENIVANPTPEGNIPATENPSETVNTDPALTATPTDEQTATGVPVTAHTADPTDVPTEQPTPTPTPTQAPTDVPTEQPTPTATPTQIPTATPTRVPTATPTKAKTPTPTKEAATPTAEPTPKRPTNVVTGITLPAGNTVYDNNFALSLFHLSGDDTSKEGVAANLKAAGFNVVFQKNYNKAKDDASHTSPFTLAEGLIDVAGTKKTIYLITVAPTCNGEWIANFDFAPSHSADIQFAENFYLAALDAFNSTKDQVLADPDAVLVVCGYSRGGSVANLLGYMFNEARDNKLNYTYAFAAGLTVHKNAAGEDTVGGYWDNIFNVVNSADSVTVLPLEENGFFRKGNDIVLNGGNLSSEWTKLKNDLLSISSTIPSYYNDKHSLTGPGLSEDGMTLFEVLSSLISDVLNSGLSGSDIDISDFSGTIAKIKAIPAVATILSVSRQSDLYPLRALLEKFTGSALLAGINYLVYAPLIEAHTMNTYLSLMGE